MKRSHLTHILRFPSTVGIAMGLCAFCLIAGQSQSVLSSDTTARAKPVRALHTPGLPVRVEGKILPAADGRGEMIIQYSVENLTATAVLGLELGLYVYDGTSRITGGQVWRQPLELSAKAAGDFSKPVNIDLRADDVVVLAVEQVRQSGSVWRANVIPFLGNTKAPVTSKAPARARFISFQDDAFLIECPSNFCDKQADKAADVCNGPGSCGVRSFSCNQNACTSSFSCYGCT